MDFESWWLIFVPLLFGLGWLAARFDFRHMLTETKSLPDSYFKGLNFLLNEQPDRAIDAFVEVAKLDPETTELHFALGSLFRRRGEMERAIRVHQSLLSRSDLPSREREHALHEIAQDYLKAGMLDRAELAYKELKNTPFEEQARRALIRIYESEHDWPQAIDAVKRLGKLTGESVPQEVHYHCEIAQQALATVPPDVALAEQGFKDAARACAADGSSTEGSRARVLILRAQLARLSGEITQERECLLQLLSDAPDYVSLVVNDLEKNFTATQEIAALLQILQTHHDKYPSLDLFQVIFKLLLQQHGSQEAWAFARVSLQRQPTLLGLDRALTAEVQLLGDGHAAQNAPSDEGLSPSLLRRQLSRSAQRLDRFGCRVCGFQAKQFYWQCPGCHGWETYRPRRLEELQ